MSKIVKVQVHPSYKQTVPKVTEEVLAQARSRVKLDQRIKEISDQIRKLKLERRELQQLKKPGVKTYVQKPWVLYALSLEGGYWYVGMSRNPEKRFGKHLRGKGAVWTRLHRPIEIVELRPTTIMVDSEASLLEDEMTLEYAKKYGVEVVRGGGYCQTKPKWPSHVYEPDLSWV